MLNPFQMLYNKGKVVEVDVKWLNRKSLPSVLKIEKENFSHPWKEDEFISYMRQKDNYGLMAIHEKTVVGYMVYQSLKTKYIILNISISPSMQRMGVGEKLVNCLSVGKKRITMEVRETNLPAQLFCRKLGFKAVNTFKNRYTGVNEDAILFSKKYE